MGQEQIGVGSNNIENINKVRLEKLREQVSSEVGDFLKALNSGLYITTAIGGEVNSKLYKADNTLDVRLFSNGKSLGYGVTIDEPLNGRSVGAVVKMVKNNMREWAKKNPKELTTTLESYDKTHLDKLMTTVEKEVSLFVSSKDSNLSARATMELDNLHVELFENGNHVFNGYTVSDPLMVDTKEGQSVEEYIVQNANEAMEYWLENRTEGSRFGYQKRQDGGINQQKVA